MRSWDLFFCSYTLCILYIYALDCSLMRKSASKFYYFVSSNWLRGVSRSVYSCTDSSLLIRLSLACSTQSMYLSLVSLIKSVVSCFQLAIRAAESTFCATFFYSSIKSPISFHRAAGSFQSISSYCCSSTFSASSFCDFFASVSAAACCTFSSNSSRACGSWTLLA